jgi:hypothetical protein
MIRDKKNEDTYMENNSSDAFDDLHLAMSQVELTEPILDNANKDPMTKNRRLVEANTVKHTPKAPDAINNIEKDLDPIVGYADEPILPLTEVCAP